MPVALDLAEQFLWHPRTGTYVIADAIVEPIEKKKRENMQVEMEVSGPKTTETGSFQAGHNADILW